MSDYGPDYNIPGFWYIQDERLDVDCDGTYPLEPVIVLAEHLDDARNQAHIMVDVPVDCTATGPLIERRATMTEIREWLAAHDAEIRADAWDEGALWAAVETGAIRDENTEWLTPEDNPYRTPRQPAPELIPGVQAAVDALSIYRKG